ncbi:MAG: DUF4058 family protein [Planctomycetes bacterium]|nr:DUF4058 family protein [Planctomycetota bacterium]
MPSPLPGMDPWLEHPARWPNVHQRLVTYAGDHLGAQVGEGFYVAIGERVYVEAPSCTLYPDVSVIEAPAPPPRSGSAAVADAPTVVRLRPVERREPYLELRTADADERVVTVIEVLSPANKRPGAGRELYLRKQAEVLASDASLVEVDLLRTGEPTVALPAELAEDAPYRVVVSRASDREARELYSVGLRGRLPRVGVPLLPGVADVVLDLGAVLTEVYDRGGFGRRLDYASEPVPPLGSDDLAWTRGLALS